MRHFFLKASAVLLVGLQFAACGETDSNSDLYGAAGDGEAGADSGGMRATGGRGGATGSVTTGGRAPVGIGGAAGEASPNDGGVVKRSGRRGGSDRRKRQSGKRGRRLEPRRERFRR
jgi:hypothetical protein